MSLSCEERFETVEEFWQVLNAHAAAQPVPLPRVTSADAPQALPLSERGSEHISSAFLQHLRDAPRSSKFRALLSILLTLLVTLAFATGFLSSVMKYDNPLSALYKSTHPFAPSIPQSTVTSTTVFPPSTLTARPSIYPRIATSYAGTIADLLANEKTDMFLTNTQQSQGNIRGSFQGLGLVSSFTGTVTPAGHIEFTVMAYAGNSTLSFEGDIKIGGDIVGNFKVLDHGHFTGESGLWNVASNP